MNEALYVPPDLMRAYHAWRATCGPAAIAALMGRTLEQVRPHLKGYRGYMSPTAVVAALQSMGAQVRATHRSSAPGAPWPKRGIAVLQLAGPWLAPDVPKVVAYTKMHIIALEADGEMVYDCNAGEGDNGAWSNMEDWHSYCAMPWVERTPRATGYWIRCAIEVR